MLNYTENYFDLKLLKLSDIKLHEATESNRLRNIYKRLSKSKYLMNPVIVGKYNREYILLDGANRYGSLKELGCKLILAQIINYKDKNLKLDNWNHLVYNFKLEDAKSYLVKNKISFEIISYNNGLKELSNKINRILITEINGDGSILVKLSSDLEEMLNQLTEFMKQYFKKFKFDRSEKEIDINELRKYSRMKGSLISFPNFQKHHIVKIANERSKLPAGISRHLISNRVLHVKYEIKKLMSDDNIKSKTEDLKRMLFEKIDQNKVRQYSESVIVFDE